MATLLISDLHLDSSRPAVTDCFIRFLDESAETTDELYILGDLFEVWFGDDDPDPHHRRVIDAIRRFTEAGSEGFFARGNRDVLIGRKFCNETGLQLLEETTVIDLYGTPALISHGDELCTDDHSYQRFRRRARSPAWRAMWFALPQSVRRYLAQHARRRSQTDTALKPEDITDVSQDAVDDAFINNHVTTIIHGHTHRPGVFEYELLRKTRTRIVLGDWYEQGSVLRWDEEGYALETLAYKA